MTEALLLEQCLQQGARVALTMWFWMNQWSASGPSWMMWLSRVLIIPSLLLTPWLMFLRISQVLRMWILFLFQQYVINSLFRVKVILSPIIVPPLGLLLHPTHIILVLLVTILIALWFQQPRSLSAVSGGPVNTFVVAAQSQLQVVQALGP